jgi:hypothetical protein
MKISHFSQILHTLLPSVLRGRPPGFNEPTVTRSHPFSTLPGKKIFTEMVGKGCIFKSLSNKG